MDTVTKKKHRLTVTTLAALAVVLLFSTVALARYIHQAVLNDYIVTAGEDFYFTSDLLVEPDGPDTSDTPVYQITHDWETDGRAIVSFKLRNYYSTLNISNCDISYSITATIQGGNVYKTSGTITSENEVLIELPLSKPESFDTKSTLPVTVTAVSTKPYTKTLQGIFEIKPLLYYEMDSNAGSPIARLTIILEKDKGPSLTREVTINWPDGAAPDMTNPMVINATDIDLQNRTLTTTLNKAAVYELIFFKDIFPEESAEYEEYTGVTVR